MLGENMVMAFHAIMANKMRSFLTMLGIIIGIGSVISIVSIGDTMRGLFADLYKDAGTTQAVVSIGYWVEDVRDSDYFTLDDLEKIREVFADEIAYIDSYASVSPDVRVGRTSMKFDLQGVDRDYQEVQPVTMVAGRYLNESDILGRKKNVVMEAESAGKLFGTEDAVGKTFRTTIYGDTDLYTVVGVYKKEMSAFQKLLMGGSSDTGSAYIPYTLLTWPNDTFYYCRLYAKEGTDMVDLMSRLTAYLGKLKGRNAGDFYTNTVADEMGSIDSMMGGLSMAVGGIAAISLIVGGIGICGRPLCCASYLSEFIPVSIKMAKEQNLSLNPTKISGVCGRLMCCLKYEEDTYEELNGRLPNIGDYVTTDDGLKGEVHSVSILRQLVKVIVTVNNDEKEIREYKVDQLKFRPKKRREKQSSNDAELKQLEALEKKEGKSKLDGD